MSYEQEKAFHKILGNSNRIKDMLPTPVMMHAQTGRLAAITEDGMVDLEENKEMITGEPEVTRKLNRLIHNTNMLTKKYIELYGDFDPLKIF